MTALRPKHIRCSNLQCEEQIYFTDHKCESCKTINPLEYLPEGVIPRPLEANGYPAPVTFDDDPLASYAFYSKFFGRKSSGIIAFIITQIEMRARRNQRLAYERDPAGYIEKKMLQGISKARRALTARWISRLAFSAVLLSVPTIIGILLLARFV